MIPDHVVTLPQRGQRPATETITTTANLIADGLPDFVMFFFTFLLILFLGVASRIKCFTASKNGPATHSANLILTIVSEFPAHTDFHYTIPFVKNF